MRYSEPRLRWVCQPPALGSRRLHQRASSPGPRSDSSRSAQAGKLRRPTRNGSGTHCHVWRRRSEQRLRRAAAMGWGKGQGRGKTLAKAGECMERIRAGRSGRGRLPTAKLIVATQHCAVADRADRWIRLSAWEKMGRLIPLTRPCRAWRCNSIYPSLCPERRGIEGRVLPRRNLASLGLVTYNS